MKGNLKQIARDYGLDSLVYIPANLFKELSMIEEIKDFKQLSFAFGYIAVNAFLYKYTSYLGEEGEMSQADYKVMLGYSETTKTVNHIIKQNGILEEHEYIEFKKNFVVGRREKYNLLAKFSHYEFDRINDMEEEISNSMKRVMKNKGYLAPEPVFLLDSDGIIIPPDNCFKITLREILKFILDKELSVCDMAMYFFIKSNASPKDGECKHLSYDFIESKLKISNMTITKTVLSLEANKMIFVGRGKWTRDSSEKREATKYTLLFGR